MTVSLRQRAPRADHPPQWAVNLVERHRTTQAAATAQAAARHETAQRLRAAFSAGIDGWFDELEAACRATAAAVPELGLVVLREERQEPVLTVRDARSDSWISLRRDSRAMELVIAARSPRGEERYYLGPFEDVGALRLTGADGNGSAADVARAVLTPWLAMLLSTRPDAREGSTA